MQLLVIGIAVITYFAGNAIPVMSNVFVDAIVRSGIVILIYAGLTLLLKVSPDLNERFTVYKNILLRHH